MMGHFQLYFKKDRPNCWEEQNLSEWRRMHALCEFDRMNECTVCIVKQRVALCHKSLKKNFVDTMNKSHLTLPLKMPLFSAASWRRSWRTSSCRGATRSGCWRRGRPATPTQAPATSTAVTMRYSTTRKNGPRSGNKLYFLKGTWYRDTEKNILFPKDLAREIWTLF